MKFKQTNLKSDASFLEFVLASLLVAAGAVVTIAAFMVGFLAFPALFALVLAFLVKLTVNDTTFAFGQTWLIFFVAIIALRMLINLFKR